MAGVADMQRRTRKLVVICYVMATSGTAAVTTASHSWEHAQLLNSCA